MIYKHLFGPVQSRRLGKSLGVDMIPLKTCNCNCVYCECGAAKTVAHERKAYVPAEELINELDHFLGQLPELDYVTFAGSGEPTLNSELGRVIRFVKKTYPRYSTALLTNGLLFHLPDVRSEAMPFDLVLPSLDAVSESAFNRVNRPFPGITTERMIEGLETFSRQYKGRMWIEVFIVPGINDTPEELTLFKTELQRINPTRVQLNSLDRPGACDWVTPATPEQLADIAASLHPLPVEIISRSGTSISSGISKDITDTAILQQLSRRPATIEEIAVLFSTTINNIIPVLNSMTEQKSIIASTVDGRMFYSACGSSL